MNIINIKINKVNKASQTIARVSVYFPDFVLHGFRINHDPVTNKDYVMPPSSWTGKNWVSIFKTNNKEDWAELCRLILKRYNEYLIEESLNEK